MPATREASSEDAALERQSSGNGARRERVADIQRARILTAAVEVIAERGAANVTVAHVVARSGVSRRTFYELFADSEACFLAAFDQAVERIAATVIPAYGRPGAWRERMRAALIALLEALEQDRDAARLVIVETLAAGPEALERRFRVLGKVIAAVDEGRAQNGKRIEPAPLAAEGVVGGALAVLHARLLVREASERESLLALTGPLMSMIALPYLGAAAARKELQRTVPARRGPAHAGPSDPLRGLQMRLTYRTVRVLTAVAEHPGCSNREVGIDAGMQDQGQASKLLSRLHRLGLIENTGEGPTKGAPNAWTLTPRGLDLHATFAEQASLRASSRDRAGAGSAGIRAPAGPRKAGPGG